MALIAFRIARAIFSARPRSTLPMIASAMLSGFGVSISTLPSVFKELDYRPIAPRRGVPILFREPLGRPGPTSRPSAGGGRDDARAIVCRPDGIEKGRRQGVPLESVL
jgi:hypothetical protein